MHADWPTELSATPVVRPEEKKTKTWPVCHTSPHPETDCLEAKQMRMCLLSKREMRYYDKNQKKENDKRRRQRGKGLPPP